MNSVMEKGVLTMESGFPSAVKKPAHERASIAEAKGLSLSFGGQRVLDNISFTIKSGQAVLLRGDNGSGKTSFLNLLSGFLHPDKGRISFQLNGVNARISSKSPERLARLGIGRLWRTSACSPR